MIGMLDADDSGMPQVDGLDLEIADSDWINAQAGFIQIAVLNGYILYNRRGGKNDFLKFSRNVIASLVFRYAVVPNMKAANQDLCRLTGRHFIYTIPPTDGKLRPQKRCKVCLKRGTRRDTRFYCPK